LRQDQAVLLERFDHGVERAIVELDALVFAALAQRGRHLVGVHGALKHARQHRQRQRIAHLALGHRLSLPVLSAHPLILRCNYSM
jgi:hypothetical protein